MDQPATPGLALKDIKSRVEAIDVPTPVKRRFGEIPPPASGGAAEKAAHKSATQIVRLMQ